MSGRKRNIQIKFRVTEKERDLIYEKMAQLSTDNMEAYLRKMAIDGMIINVDYSGLKEMTMQIQKIGVNINQIAHRVNETGEIHQKDIETIKKAMIKIWRLQRLSLSKAL